ncbi:hypothetical protein E3P89_02387 [Wallemia ichthyophaga]|nr:hypothetical protein E3P91_02842 [Wallemia ichthyophaga]TIB21898.1 hypothetical protein E3P89_02387 [Wallemia ichthyophaga]TIB23640.1 hypothetical protein E3P88_02478 [Wallemia ichthyophaga]TIB62363.1 hypothetical protein E3P78_02401 [Wallemia ichthyophaga]
MMDTNTNAHADAELKTNTESPKNAEDLSTNITQPTQLYLNTQDTRKLSTDSSQHTHVCSRHSSSFDKYHSSSTIHQDSPASHDLLNQDIAYYFPNKAYRFQKKWVLVAMTALSFATIGINDSAVGALMPQMEKYYHKSEAIMSFSFLANSGGYVISTATSSFLIHHLQLRYVLMIASCIYSLGSLIGTFRPPFGALMVSFILTGFGGGLLDTAATSVIVHFEDGPLLTVTYSFFSLGSMASPFLVGGLQSGDKQPWELYFWFPFSLAAFLFLLQWFVYRSYKAPIEKDALHLSAARKFRLVITDWTIIIGVSLTFVVFAMQDSWSQWASKYLQDTKELGDGIPQIAQGTFWAGVAVSRIVLCKLVAMVGDIKASVSLCAMFALVLVGVWLVETQHLAGAICLNILLGFVDGPLVPVVLSTSVNTLPHYLKQPATSAIVCGGLVGSSIIPLAVGQAVNAFSTDIVPGVLIVIAAVSILLYTVLYTTKYLKLMKDNDIKPSISGWMKASISKNSSFSSKHREGAQQSQASP